MAENRVAVIAIIVENMESASAVNAILHEYSLYIVGRMGLPYRERSISIINIVLDAPMDKINAVAGQLGRLPGVTAKAVCSTLG
ncbi:MAG: iron-only hydrogenase system regulator [Lentisphaerae bacterium]|nr:iron-only hydrogenase system regulator [Lentisphaerota bacterium]